MVWALGQPSGSINPNGMTCRLQFNKTNLKRAEKRKWCIEDNTVASKKFTRQSIDVAPPSTETCFFCGMPPVGETLRNASTFQVDVRVRQCAVKLQDTALLAKLSAGDMIAQEAKYHTQCLVSLYNKAKWQHRINAKWSLSIMASHLLDLSHILKKPAWTVLLYPFLNWPTWQTCTVTDLNNWEMM